MRKELIIYKIKKLRSKIEVYKCYKKSGEPVNLNF